MTAGYKKSVPETVSIRSRRRRVDSTAEKKLWPVGTTRESMNLAVSILLVLVGVSIIGYWIFYVLRGHLPQGLKTIESGGYIAFHILAEMITAILCIIGGVWLARNERVGPLIALLGSGMLLYTCINGLAWKEVRSKPLMSLLFIPPAVIAVLSAVYLILF